MMAIVTTGNLLTNSALLQNHALGLVSNEFGALAGKAGETVCIADLSIGILVSLLVVPLKYEY
jgi:hypothetical protein